MKDVSILNGSLWKNIFMFSMPIALTDVVQQLFNAADVMVLGKFVSSNAMAAVGSDSPITSLFLNLFIGISLGVNVVIAQFIGMEDEKRANKAVHNSILFAFICGIIVGILGEVLAVPLLKATGVPKEVFSMSLLYLRIYFIGLPFFLVYNNESAIFKSRGDTKTPLICLILSGLLNLGLNLLFVLVFKMNVNGVAIATVVSNGVCIVILTIILAKGPEVTKLYLSRFKFDRQIIKKILKIGLPAGIQIMTFSLANIFIQTAVNSFGATVMAASSAAFNVEIIAYYFVGSFGQACTTFVGQNFGAENYKRCRDVLKVCIIEDAIVSAFAVGLIVVSGKLILRLFTNDAQIIEIAYIRLIIIFIAYAFSLFMEVFSGYLRGFGLSTFPAVSSIFGVCGTRLLWIYLVVYPSPHPTFALLMLIYPISLCLTAVIDVIVTAIYKPSRRAENHILNLINRDPETRNK